jgi:hypothetical protein
MMIMMMRQHFAQQCYLSEINTNYTWKFNPISLNSQNKLKNNQSK